MAEPGPYTPPQLESYQSKGRRQSEKSGFLLLIDSVIAFGPLLTIHCWKEGFLPFSFHWRFESFLIDYFVPFFPFLVVFMQIAVTVRDGRTLRWSVSICMICILYSIFLWYYYGLRLGLQ